MVDKRLLVMTATLSHGGSERVISILSNVLLNSFENIEILMYYDMPIWYEINDKIKITIIEKETKTKNVLKNLCWMRKYIKANADIVLSFLAPFNMLTITSLLGSGIPVIVADRNDPRYIPNRAILRFFRNILYNFANGIIVQTENNFSYFSKNIQKKSVVIYNPVFIDGKKGKALTTNKQKKIVSVGRLTEQKNQKMLINAFKNILKIYPEYKLIIYGEGDAHQQLNEYIYGLQLEDSIELAGVRQDVHDCIMDAEMFVLTSNYEGMPNALIEAMCLGLPVISTEVSGAVDLIKNGENGILIHVGDEKACSKAMSKLISDRLYAKQLAQNATELAKKLDINYINKQWMNFISQFII